ncbi:MAG: hypothetical protein IK031_02410 [Bacteroidales bacterium]|nr:hypothetical protein [Bacteroidales bacterium]
MKKAFFRLMGLVLGLNVFTACYGPAPGNWEYQDPVEQTDESEEDGEGTEAEDKDQLPE